MGKFGFLLAIAFIDLALALVILGSAGQVAAAATLHKCVDAQGHASYQSMPCPAGSQQAWVRDATPEPEPAPAPRRQRAQPREAGARSAAQTPDQGLAWGSQRQTPRPASSAACRAARDADAAYRRQPLRLVTHDGLRRHGDRIRAACG